MAIAYHLNSHKMGNSIGVENGKIPQGLTEFVELHRMIGSNLGVGRDGRDEKYYDSGKDIFMLNKKSCLGAS